MLNNTALTWKACIGFNLLILTVTGSAVELAPDAGVILRNEKPIPEAPKSTEAPINLPNRPQSETETGVKVMVKGWRISGQSLVAESVLQDLLAPAIGKEMSLNELRSTLQNIDAYYQKQGYFARSVLPAQQLQDGVIQVVIREGKLGKIEVEEPEALYQDDRLKRTLQNVQHEGEYLQMQDLQRGILLLNDLSGGSVSSTLKPGMQPGESDLSLKAYPRSLISGNLDYANAGIRSVGQNQYGGTLNINNPLKIGDLATARLQGTSGNVYGRLSYALPVGYSGFKLGVQVSGLDYSLGGPFKVLNAQGSSWAGGMFATYPLLRGLETNLNVSAGFDDRRYYNTSLNTVISDKEAQTGYIGVNGDFRDQLVNKAYNQFNAVLIAGNLDLSAAPMTCNSITPQQKLPVLTRSFC